MCVCVCGGGSSNNLEVLLLPCVYRFVGISDIKVGGNIDFIVTSHNFILRLLTTRSH